MNSQIDNEGKALQRVNVMLSREALAWLEKAALKLHQNTGASVSRSELLRGILRGFVRARLNFCGCRSEEEIATALAECLRGGRNSEMW